jgi:hypothetical protein
MYAEVRMRHPNKTTGNRPAKNKIEVLTH